VCLSRRLQRICACSDACDGRHTDSKWLSLLESAEIFSTATVKAPTRARDQRVARFACACLLSLPGGGRAAPARLRAREL